MSGDSVFVGINLPRTGSYQLPGGDKLTGYELAIEHLNAGHKLIRAMAPKVTTGLLGKKVEQGDAVHRLLLQRGRGGAEQAGGGQKVLHLPGVSGSNETTGKGCTRYSFRTCFHGRTAAAALAPVLIKTCGKDKKVAFLTPDYAYGHTVQHSMLEYLGKGGGKMATNQVSPPGASDFSSCMLNVANSGADAVVNINRGNDAFSSVKQAAQFGILEKMKMVVAYQIPFLAKEATPELTQGMLVATDFWWTRAGRYPLAKMFVEEVHQKYGDNPQ
ncbi:MAG: ABC transporter substrate-binding protein [Rhodospirillales bacterium]|nr:ABC transporter substrate-binding protein [Rhodospirillales bacterium]